MNLGYVKGEGFCVVWNNWRHWSFNFGIGRYDDTWLFDLGPIALSVEL